jgi:hypothetical protein
MKLKKKAPKPKPIRQVPLHNPIIDIIFTLAIGEMVVAVLQGGHVPIPNKEPIKQAIYDDI